MSKITNDGLAQDASCIHMVTVGIKGLMTDESRIRK